MEIKESLLHFIKKYTNQLDASIMDELCLIESIIAVEDDTQKKVANLVLEYVNSGKNNTLAVVMLFLRAVEYATTIRMNSTKALQGLLSLVNQKIDLSSYTLEGDSKICMLVQDACATSLHTKTDTASSPMSTEDSIVEAIMADDVGQLEKLDTKAHPTVKFVSQHTFLFPNGSATLLQFSAICGSLKCFNFLASVFPIDESISLFAVAGGNIEIVDAVYQKGINLQNCIDSCIAFHRFEVFDWLQSKYGNMCSSISPLFCVQCFNEPVFVIANNHASDIEYKYSSLEECNEQGNTIFMPALRQFVTTELTDNGTYARKIIADKYVSRYTPPDCVPQVKYEINKLIESKCNLEEFRIRLFFITKGLKIDYSKLIEMKNDDEYSSPFLRARNLIVNGDQSVSYLGNIKNVPLIRHPSEVCAILGEWKDEVTIFNMTKELGVISGRSFKQRVQKSGLCYIHAPVLYLYYAVRRNNHDWNEMLDVSELIKKTFTNYDLYNYIMFDRGGSSADVMSLFACTAINHARANGGVISEDKKPRYTTIDYEDVTEDFFRAHGPLLLSNFAVTDDFKANGVFSYIESNQNRNEIQRIKDLRYHAMLIIGVRSKENQKIFLVQNWWPKKQFIEISGSYISAHGGQIGYIKYFNICNYDAININATTFEPIIETSVSICEQLNLELNCM